MNKKKIILSITLILFFAGVSFLNYRRHADKSTFLSYKVNLRKQDFKLYWKDEKGVPFRSLGRLKSSLESQGEMLLFAMNGGMYKGDNSPQGLFIEAGELRTPLDTADSVGNFYLKPNGVFYTTTEGRGFVCKTEDFKNLANVEYATQSGPMLLIDGRIHPAFKAGSQNLNIRNGVGILPNGKVLFAMSKQLINFYDFALFFKNEDARTHFI